tara:strand:+ start:3782 stop:3913 length:132 start_codon:yes stop_codon:yes gene_type:complete
MQNRYINFYRKFNKAFQGKKLNHCFVQVSNNGVEGNSQLRKKI